MALGGEKSKSTVSRPAIFDDALITSYFSYGEKDAIVRLFTKSEGRISAFFRNALSIKQKSTSPLQAPTFAHVSFILNESGKLAALKSVDIEPSTFLGQSAKILGFKSYVAELVEYFLPEGMQESEVYDLCLEVFHELTVQGPNTAFLRSFEVKLLNACGYLPELSSDSSIKAFDPEACVFLSTPHEGTKPFSDEALKLLQIFLEEPIKSASCPDKDLERMVAQVFIARLKLFNRAPLKSVRYLQQLHGRP